VAIRRAYPGRTCPFDEEACVAVAAQEGYICLLEQLWAESYRSFLTEDTYYEAAIHGHLGVIKSLRSRSAPWDEGACAGAAMGGHLGVLIWLAHRGGMSL
jgi:hypothetical protein